MSPAPTKPVCEAITDGFFLREDCLDGVLRSWKYGGIPSRMSDKKDHGVTLEAGTHWMCTCGKSANYPLCDGAHKGSGKGPEKLVLEEATVIPVMRPPAGE